MHITCGGIGEINFWSVGKGSKFEGSLACPRFAFQLSSVRVFLKLLIVLTNC